MEASLERLTLIVIHCNMTPGKKTLLDRYVNRILGWVPQEANDRTGSGKAK